MLKEYWNCHSCEIFVPRVKNVLAHCGLLYWVAEEIHWNIYFARNAVRWPCFQLLLRGKILLRTERNEIFLLLFFLYGLNLSAGLLCLDWTGLGTLGGRFFHDFSVIPKTLDNKFAGRWLDPELSGCPADRVALA